MVGLESDSGIESGPEALEVDVLEPPQIEPGVIATRVRGEELLEALPVHGVDGLVVAGQELGQLDEVCHRAELLGADVRVDGHTRLVIPRRTVGRSRPARRPSWARSTLRIDGVRRDDAQAFHWFRKAAEQGDGRVPSGAVPLPSPRWSPKERESLGIQCRLGAVCRPRCRVTPLLAGSAESPCARARMISRGPDAGAPEHGGTSAGAPSGGLPLPPSPKAGAG